MKKFTGDYILRKVQKFVNDHLLKELLSSRIGALYLFFWARFVVWMRKPFIVGVTGSVGKTTTTEMIAAVLMHPEAQPIVGLVRKTSRNMNDNVGLPLTVLRYERWLNRRPEKLLAMCVLPFRALTLATLSHYPTLLVLEYGAHGKGHLHRLAKLAPPNIGVVTTVGPAHLEHLKTIEGVVREKSAVVRAVPPSGLVILGQDHSYVSDLERETQAPVMKVAGRGAELSQNIARAIGQHLGVPEEVINSALADFKPVQGRLNRLEFTNLTILDDSYNANPLSMKLGLDTLAETARPGQRRLAVLGAMAELGEESPAYHNAVGTYSRGRADVVIGVGELAKHYHPDHWFDSSDACAEQIEGLIRSGDFLLVKGSYSVHMDRVVLKLAKIATKQVPSDNL